MTDAQVTVVVVNYRSGGDLEECLRSILSDERHLARLVVFDNGSGDDSWAPAKTWSQRDDRVGLLLSDDNVGLAEAVNQILPSIGTPLMAVVNPDVVVDPGWLDPLVEALDGNQAVGVACPLVLMRGSGRVNSAGQHVHVTGLGFNRHLHDEAASVGSRPHEVGGFHGAAFVIRTDLLRELGGWDATGFIYHEDVALSWDVLLEGARIVCVPESRVSHDYHLTMYPEKLYHLEKNRWALLLSHLRGARLAAISPMIILTELMVWGLALIRGGGFLRAKARAYWWIWNHRGQISAWRRRVMTRRHYDGSLLNRSVRWTYPVSQLGVLGGERGESARQPPGGLPV